MPDLIDLAAERNKRDAPDPQFVRTDDFGRPMYAYSVRYATMDGKQWGGVTIWAYDFAEALRRMEAIRASGKVDGQLMAEVPA